MADDWKKKWDESGYYFSDEDRKRAESDSAFRDAIYNAKETYASGNTALGHQMAEDARRQYNYSGGVAGDEYNAWETPKQTATVTTARPSWDSNGATMQAMNAAAAALANYGTYTDPYAERIETSLNGLLNRDPFSYDYTTDPAWQAYKKQYTREGERASEDTLGQYAAMTGGMPSTAAATAASQAHDYYMAQMTDKIPELYKLAYQMYSDDYNRDLSNLTALRGLSDTAYGRWGDEYGRAYDLFNVNRTLNNDEYGRFRDTVGDWETDRAYTDTRADIQYNRDKQEEANKIYAYGDGEPYEIGTGKGQSFVLNSVPGDTMTGGDGSRWENVNGQIVITKDGKRWAIGTQAATTGSYKGTPSSGWNNVGVDSLVSADMWHEIVTASRSDPATAAALLAQWGDYLNDAQRNTLMMNAGLAIGSMNSAKEAAAYASLFPSEDTSGDAGDAMMTEAQWKKNKMGYDTYDDYVRAVIEWYNS